MRWLSFLRTPMLLFGSRVILAVIVILIAALVIRILLAIVRRSLAAGKVEPTTRTLIVSVCRFSAWIVVIAGVLWVLGLTMISAAVAALALAQGASGTTADILAGIFLVADRELTVGRRVSGSGVEGTVEAITVRKTMIRADDGTLHVVPNRVLDAAAYSVKSQPLSSPSMGKE